MKMLAMIETRMATLYPVDYFCRTNVIDMMTMIFLLMLAAAMIHVYGSLST